MSEQCDEYRRRAERLLGWEEGDSNSYSFTALRALIRDRSPKLHYLMGLAMDAGEHLLDTQEKK